MCVYTYYAYRNIIITINGITTALFYFYYVSKYEKIHQYHPNGLLENNRDQSGIRGLIITFAIIIPI